ncbi:MAG: beta-ketoacyl-[acyl-carrier-protein] synthase family protein [Nitrospirae bacterium]|nr:beta-ketoacyl-[acyl-carrier-protein] synthase family protein [Nitrospirota bacterium]
MPRTEKETKQGVQTRDTERDIVVTGIGIISAIGIGKDAYWKGLEQGRHGFRDISIFDTSEFNVHVGGEVPDFDPEPYIGKKDLRILDRSTKLVTSAARLAIDDAGLDINEESTHYTGVSVGTTFGSLHSIAQFDLTGLTEGPRFVNPSLFPNTVINSPASQVSIRFRIKGFNTTVSTGFCASLDAVVYAADFIRLRRVEAVLAGGVEELCEETFRGFHTLGFLSGADGSPPVCCPFDARRNGIIFSEGAAVLILESGEHALRRGATVLAKVSGYGNSFDPAGCKGRDNDNGLCTAVKLALNEASLDPEDIDYISASANSTQELDSMETEALKKVFGKHAYAIPVSSIKSMVGETFSASGALSLSAAVGAISNGLLPPTINYSEKDPECDLDYVPNKARKKSIRTALVISSDPYGNSTAVVLERP